MQKIIEALKGKDIWWGLLTVLILGFMMWLMAYCLVTGKNMSGIADLRESIMGVLMLLIGYRYGSSKGSKDKTDLLKASPQALPPNGGTGSPMERELSQSVEEASPQPSAREREPNTPVVVEGFASKAAVVLLAGLLLMAGCRGSKVVSNVTKTEVRDSVVTNADTSSRVDSAMWAMFSHEEVDTAVGVHGGFVEVNEAVDANLDTSIKVGNVTLTTYTDNKGTRHIKCAADSLTLVIRGLVRDKEAYRSRYDSVLRVGASVVKTSDSTTLHKVVRKENEGFWNGLWTWLKNGLAIIGGGFLVVEGIHLTIKKFSV